MTTIYFFCRKISMHIICNKMFWSFFSKPIVRKNLKRRFVGHPWPLNLWNNELEPALRLKIYFEFREIHLKMRFDPFLFIQNDFLQHIGYIQFYMRQSKFCLRQPLKNFKDIVNLRRLYPFKFFKGCLPQNLLSPLLNTLPYTYSVRYHYR